MSAPQTLSWLLLPLLLYHFACSQLLSVSVQPAKFSHSFSTLYMLRISKVEFWKELSLKARCLCVAQQTASKH